MIHQDGIELLTKTARNEQLKKSCEKEFAAWYAPEAIKEIIKFLDKHPAADQLSLHPKFSADLLELLPRSGSLLDRESITLPQLLYELLCRALYSTRIKEAGPAKRDDTHCLINHHLRDIYKNELFFCEMLAFYPRETVIQHFFKLKLSLNELVLNDFNFLNWDKTGFSDPLWKQYFLARYIAHSLQLVPYNDQFNDLNNWISENKKDNKHLNVWQFTTWIMLANQAYDPLKEFHSILFESFAEDDQHGVAVFKSCQEGIQFVPERESFESDDTYSHFSKLFYKISHIDRYDYNKSAPASPVMKVFRLTVPQKKNDGNTNNNASSSSKQPGKN